MAKKPGAKVISLGSRVLSVIQSRAQLAQRAGVLFGDKRDLYTVLGYKKILTPDDYLSRYARDNIATRIVNAPAKATWQLRPTIVEHIHDPASSTPEFIKFNEDWKAIDDRLKLMNKFQRLDRLTGLGRYGVLLLGLNGQGDLAAPARKCKGPDDLIYISCYPEHHAEIDKLDEDPLSPRYGLPEIYNLTTLSTIIGTSKKELTIPVHWSRIIHVAEDLLEDDIYGTPRLQNVYNLMDDLSKVVGGSAEAYWLIANRGMQANVDPEMELSTEDEAALEDEIEEYFHELRRFIRTKGVEINALGSEAQGADPRGVFSVLTQLISGSTGIPQRILFGSERGQLASMQDRKNWSERIKERQVDFGEAQVLRPVIDRLQSLSILPPLANGYDVVWPEIEVLTEQEKSEVAARTATGIRQVSMQESKIVSPGEFRSKYLGLPSKPPSDIDEVGTDDEPNPVPSN